MIDERITLPKNHGGGGGGGGFCSDNRDCHHDCPGEDRGRGIIDKHRLVQG